MTSRSNGANGTTGARLPPPNPLPPPRPRPRRSPRQINYEAELRSPWFRRFRSKYLAIGVAVMASTGALFGAQLKTLWQDWQANEERKVVRMAAAAAAAGGEEEGEAKGGKERKVVAVTTPQEEEGGPTLSDLNRSIASLENVRGQLVTRKMQEEQRLSNLYERMERARVLEARRAQAAAAATATAAAGEPAGGEAAAEGAKATATAR